MPFPFYRQLNAKDCGPTCLRMIAAFYGKEVSSTKIIEYAGYTKQGVSLLGISEAAENLGFRTKAIQSGYDQLISEAILPCILHWDQNHFVVLVEQFSSRFRSKKIIIADPAKGMISMTKDDFLTHWTGSIETDKQGSGIALQLEPTSEFYQISYEKKVSLRWNTILHYLKQNRRDLFKVLVALFLVSCHK